MPSTYSTNLGIELPEDGELDGLWGDVVNLNMNILDRAINGSVTLTLSGTSSTLTTSDGVLSNGQYKLLVLGGLPSGTHTITIAPNDAQKIYFVRNTTAQSVVFTQGSGGNVTIAAGDSGIIYSDGGGASAAVVNLTNDFAMNSVKITGGSITGITDLAVGDGGTGASDAPTALVNLGLTATAAELNVLDGITASTAELNILDGVTASTAELNILDGVTASTSEINILDGVTATTAELNILDGATLTTTELNYVDGVTSPIQTQIDGKQAADATLTSLSGLSLAAGDVLYATAADTVQRLAIGTAGHVLAVNSGATAPEWVQSAALGVGQTWQTPSRTHSTSYQNTTGRPIMVSIGTDSNSGRFIQVSADNSTWINLGETDANRWALAFVVPNNWYYRITGGSITITAWAELR